MQGTVTLTENGALFWKIAFNGTLTNGDTGVMDTTWIGSANGACGNGYYDIQLELTKL